MADTPAAGDPPESAPAPPPHDPNSPGPHRANLTIPEAMELAVEIHQRGDFGAAEKIYQRVLEMVPDHPDALHFMGVVAHKRGQLDQALDYIKRALALVPDYVDARNNLGNVLAARGDLAEAEAAYREVLAARPEHAGAHTNVGTMLRRRGDLAAAEVEFRKALELNPKHWEAYHLLGSLLADMDREEQALGAFGKAVELHTYDNYTHHHLGFAFYMHGRIKEAADVYRRWVELQPENEMARHYLAACTGADVPARASDTFVQHTFDVFASSFDKVLTGLDYRAPALTTEAVAAVVGAPAAALDVLDAGAGTGMCGPLLRPYARRLTGVDLSARMLEKAKERGVYDALDEAELTAYIAAHPAAFDLIVSADTLVYFGDLGPALAAAAAALRPGGHLVFTIEHARQAPPEGFILNPHGRYSHHEGYVRGALTAAGLEPLSLAEVVLRNENKHPVHGLLVTARR